MTIPSHIPVGTVCAMFGLNPNTIRTWERRYQFPSPSRNAGGHRTYTPRDIELISSIVNLMNSGKTPSEAIREIMSQAEPDVNAPASDNQRLMNSLIAAARALETDRILQLMRELQERRGYVVAIEQVAFPVLAQLGHDWERTGKGVAAEHAFTLAVSHIISERALSQEVTAPSNVVTLACAPGELHQLPVLHLGNLVLEKGIARPAILAAGLPIEETLEASKQLESAAIVLSATMPPPAAETRQWITTCIEAGWADRIILAGAGFMRSRVYADFPVRAAAGDFAATVRYIGDFLNQQPPKDN